MALIKFLTPYVYFVYMNCITWNSRGSGFKSLPCLVKDLVRQYKVDIFVILELRINGDRVVNLIIKIGFQAYVRVDVENYSRGICVMWNPSKVGISMENFNK